MMESIKEHGLDPGDAFYVIEDDSTSDLIVVDGNRRLSALLVLSEPNRLLSLRISEALRKRLATAASGFDQKTTKDLNCVQFDSRAAADEWILRRHGRGMEGEGRIFWGTLEIQRFQRDRSVIDVIDFIAKNSTFDDERWARISQALGKPSAFRRFLDAKVIKDLLGLSIVVEGDERIPEFTADPKQTVAVLSKIASDIADGEIDTRNYNKKEAIEQYVQDLPAALRKVAKGKKPEPKRFRDVTIVDEQTRPRQKARAAKSEVKPTKKSTARPPRPRLAPSRHPFAQPSSEKGKRLIYEASLLKLRETPLAAGFLLRAVLEHTIDAYMDQNGMPMINAAKGGQKYDLKNRAQQVFDHLVASGRAKREDLRGVERTLTNSKDPASIQALNDYTHNKFHIPVADNLRSAWDSAEALLVAVYGAAE